MKHVILEKSGVKGMKWQQHKAVPNEAKISKLTKERENFLLDHGGIDNILKDKQKLSQFSAISQLLHEELQKRNLQKSKKVWVPPSGKKKGYYRMDPREKQALAAKQPNVLDLLKNLLNQILGMKKQGKFTKEQRQHISKKLKELEPKLKHFKTQKQRVEVSKALKSIRKELGEKVKQAEKHGKEIRSKDGKQVPEEQHAGLKQLGYSLVDMSKMSLHEIKTVYYNNIKKE